MFLTLTADRRFSKVGDHRVFLGGWCLPPGPAGPKDPPDEILPYVFDDRAALYDAYLYVDETYRYFLPQLVRLLNGIHRTDHRDRYWEILVGYWLRQYLEVLYERYVNIRAALRVAAERGERIHVELVRPGDCVTPEDTRDFELRCIEDDYNQQIYTRIIEHTGGFEITYAEPGQGAIAPDLGGWRSRLKGRLKESAKWACLVLSRRNGFFICSTYFPLRTLLGSAYRLRIFPTFDTPRFRFESRTPIDPGLREALRGMNARDDFEELAGSTIWRDMPRIYLENFPKLRRAVRRHYPKRVKLIATSNAFASNEGFKLWTAEQTEMFGVPYVILQHGGNYGSALWNSNEDYETAVADLFLTYGWDDPGKDNVIPFFANRISAPDSDRICGDPRGDILWVLVSLPRYAYTMYSVPVGSQVDDYLNDQARFIGALPDRIRSLVRCRPFPIAYGWSDIARIRQKAGPFAIDPTRKPIRNRLSSIRLFVGTYNATAHLESMAANVPTVLYWNPEHWEIRPSARDIMEALHEVGILHFTPEDAARKVAEIGADTIAWWGRAEIQDVRKRFCTRFARTHPDAGRLWADWFRQHGSTA